MVPLPAPEGHNAETIAANRVTTDEPLIPSIYWDYTTRRVLTMQYMHGIKITDYPTLDGFNFLDEIKPYVTGLVGGSEGVFAKVIEQVKETATSFVELPGLSNRVLRRLDQGDLTVRVPLQPLIEATDRNTAALQSLSLTAGCGFSLSTFAYLLVHHQSLGAGACFALALFLGLGILKNKNRGQRRRHGHPRFIDPD